MNKKLGIVKVTKQALATVFAPGGQILEARVLDEDVKTNCISLIVEADWCPEVHEGCHIQVVSSPELSLEEIRRIRSGQK